MQSGSKRVGNTDQNQRSILDWAKKSKPQESVVNEALNEDSVPPENASSTIQESFVVQHLELNDVEANKKSETQTGESSTTEISVQNTKNVPPAQQLKERTVNFQMKWFNDFPWLHHDTTTGSVLCFVCMGAKTKKLFPDSMKLEPAFISTGFKNWKDARNKFQNHQVTSQHKHAVEKFKGLSAEPIAQTFSIVDEKQKNEARKALRIISTSIKYLSRQGLAIQGHESDRGNFMELLRLRTDDVPFLANWLQGSKPFTSHDIQNELISIYANEILREKIVEIRNNGIFSLIVDETADMSTKELVSISIRSVDDELNVSEHFLGLYQTSSTTGEELVRVILDALKRFNLNLSQLRGQCYDGASNMSGKYSGVQARILEIEERAMFVHCKSHNLNLALQDMTKKIPLFRDTLQYINDVAVMVGRSPKRLAMINDIARDHDVIGSTTRLKPLCPTRWTVRLASINSILKNYEIMLAALEELAKSTDPVSSTASGLYSQFEKGSTYLVVLIFRGLFELTERFAELLQRPGLTVQGSMEAAEMVALSLVESNSLERFNELWSNMVEKCETWNLIFPSLPRARKQSTRLVGTTAEKNQGETSQDVKGWYFSIYKTAINALIDTINERFKNSSIKEYRRIEELLLKSIIIEEDANNSICKKYGLNLRNLNIQLQMFRKFKEKIESVKHAKETFVKLHKDAQFLLPDVHSLLKLLLVVPASTATAERSFSVVRRLKTYLRSTMTQKRLNNLALLHVYQEELDEMDDKQIEDEFVTRNDYRLSVFGK